MNPEYDFADEPNATNEKQADDQSTGDHEDSDEEGVQGPPPPTEFKRLLGEWAKDLEKLEAVAYHQAAASEEISEVEAKRLYFRRRGSRDYTGTEFPRITPSLYGPERRSNDFRHFSRNPNGRGNPP
jgi:hypothetical protein